MSFKKAVAAFTDSQKTLKTAADLRARASANEASALGKMNAGLLYLTEALESEIGAIKKRLQTVERRSSEPH